MNIFKKVSCGFVFALSIYSPNYVFADEDEIQKVVITPVHYDCTDILSGRCGWGYLSDPFANPEPDPGLLDIAKKILSTAAKVTSDIRCLGLATVSKDDDFSRYLGAVQIYNQLGKAFSFEIDSLGRKMISVTYADEGSEKWFVTVPSFSDGGLQAVQGTLVTKSGKVIPKSDC